MLKRSSLISLILSYIFLSMSLINFLHFAYVLETREHTKLSSVFQGSDEELMAHSEDEHEVDAGANKG